MATTLKEIIEYSKANPNTDYAKQAFQNIQSGKWDDKAKAEAIDLSFAGRGNYASTTPVATEEKSTLGAKLKSAFGVAKDVVTDIPSDFMETGEKLRAGLAETGTKIVQKATADDRSLTEKATMVGGEAFKGIGGFVTNSLMGIAKLGLPQDAEDSIAAVVQGIGTEIQNYNKEYIAQLRASTDEKDKMVVAKLDELVGKYQNDPKFKDMVDAGGGFLMGLLDIAGGSKGVSLGKEAIETGVEATVKAAPIVGDALKTGGEAVVDAGGKIINKGEDIIAARKAEVAVKQAEAERDIVTEMIAPGLTKKEVRKAVDEGRVTRGDEGFWIGKKPDIVSVSDKVIEMADTVQRRIPDAAKLDDVTLNSRLKSEIETVASDLEPKMKEVKLRDITPSETPIVKVAKKYKTADEFVDAFNKGELDVATVDRIKSEYGDSIFENPDALRDLYTRSQKPSMIDVALDVWDRVKVSQQNTPEFLDFPSNKAFQERFETHLGQITKGNGEKTLADLWNVRKSYDASIPERIKQANDMSPIQSQIQKEMWLENRRILNDLINDSTRGLGAESQQAFKDMSQMYSARENILGKAKVDLKGESGVVGKTKDAVLDRALPFGIGSIIF